MCIITKLEKEACRSVHIMASKRTAFACLHGLYYTFFRYTGPRCELLPSTDTFNVTHSDESPVAGTIATYSCLSGTIQGENTRTCRCDGTWEPINDPECDDDGDGKNNMKYRYIIDTFSVLTDQSLVLNYATI